MKFRVKTAIVLAAFLSAGMSSQAATTSEKKLNKPHAQKAPAKSAAASGKAKAKTALAAGTGHAKGAASKTLASRSTADKAAVRKVAAVEPAPKVRKAAQSFDDPARLALYSASALVLDQATGHPIIEKQSHAVTPIASISKLMTAMVVLDAKLDMQEVVAIGEEDVDSLKGTRSRLPVGTTMTRETAMLLALMSSENRAAHTLGRHYPGGMHAFVQAMNRKAQALGMSNTRFEEPTGLSSNNVSTAHDLARMVAAAARYPEIRQFSTTAEAKVELNGHIREFHNTNALVRSDNWEIGVSKTGYISEAGRCLVMQARVADKPVVIVLLDSNGKMTRVGDANRIKRWMESASLAQDGRHA